MKKLSITIGASEWREAAENLFTSDGCENAGVFFCGLSDTETQVRLLAKRFAPVPMHRYIDRRDYHLEVSPQFYNDVITEADRTGEHLVIIHSHRFAGEARYSPSDDYGESNLLPVLSALLPKAHVASLVASHTHVNGRRIVDGEFMKLGTIQVTGAHLTTTGGQASKKDFERYDRQLRAFGREGQEVLRSQKIGIVGAGGIGSIVAEQLARIGIGSITLVDHDAVEESNLSRILGATVGDIGQPKVNVIARHLRNVGEAQVFPIEDSAIKQDVLRQLRDCDAIFSCVDNDRARAVLNRFSHQYLVPVIDTGVRLDARSGAIEAAAGRVSIVGEGFTCLRCSHHLSSERIRAESMPIEEREKLAAEGYVMGVVDPVPAVLSLNTTLAGLAATAFLNLFVNLTGGRQPAGQIYDATTGSVFPTAPVHETGCDICDLSVGVRGLGDQQIVSAY